MTILPLVILAVLGLALVLGWAVVNVTRAVRARRPVRVLHGATLLATAAGVGLIWSTAWYVYAALGHSARLSPGTRIALLAGGIICFLLPGGALVWCRRRRLKRERSPKG